MVQGLQAPHPMTSTGCQAGAAPRGMRSCPASFTMAAVTHVAKQASLVAIPKASLRSGDETRCCRAGRQEEPAHCVRTEQETMWTPPHPPNPSPCASRRRLRSGHTAHNTNAQFQGRWRLLCPGDIFNPLQKVALVREVGEGHTST